MNLDRFINVFEKNQSNDLTELWQQNKVLRQTYILLSINLLFSAFCAYLGILLHIRVPGLIHLIGFILFSHLVYKNSNSSTGIIWLFVFTGFLGFAVSRLVGGLIAANSGMVVVKALIGAAIIFASLSLYVLMTKRNFSFLGAFLFIGLFIGFLGIIGILLFKMTGIQVALSALFLVVFSGYVLYDTSNIIQGRANNYITATLSLFVDIFRIFTNLLRILSAYKNQ